MNTSFNISATPIQGLQILQRTHLGDSRGYLERLFCTEELQTLIEGKLIVQINHTFTAKRGTVRGMHFQHPPHTETKFVACLRGDVFDVAVDVRRDSPSFLQWHGELLSADNHKTLVIPEGFAHGFQTLTDHCEILYFHTAAYQSDAESGLNAQDPRLTIHWPLPISEQSERDKGHPIIQPDFRGIVI